MEIIVICVAALFTAILTFFSGFGLGTILMPVFAIFFPIDLAVALTGVVHFTNNLFKITLVGRNADKNIILRFGIPAIIFSFLGAWLLFKLSSLPPIYRYHISSMEFSVTPVKLTIAVLLILFSFLELIPTVQKIRFNRNRLFIGGALSGFFGGLAGIQGALRSAFLIRSGLSKEAYIATGVVIASLVDITRLSVYASRFKSSGLGENLTLIISATMAAIAGAYIGSRLLKKITLRFIQILVSVMLFLIAIALGAGFI